MISLDELGNKITEYQRNNSSSLKVVIIDHLSFYIRNYPKIAFRVNDEDIRSDYFLYTLERIDVLLDNFQADTGKFSTYLSIRLRTFYINFKKQEQKRKVDVSFHDDNSNFTNDQNVWVLADSESENDYFDVNDELKEVLRYFPSFNESPLTYLVLKLYYFDLFNDEDFIKLKSFLELPFSKLMAMLDSIREDIFQKKQEQVRIEGKLKSTYQELIELQKKEVALRGQPREEKQKLIDRINQRREKILERFYQINQFPNVKLIAELVKQPTAKIANILSYQKKQISQLKNTTKNRTKNTASNEEYL